ncbi:MAG: hypothetical protein KME16_04130 [Scytolyngbya sp. HA4215-MV1]|jgi:flagellar basal body rod protein FlgF|nr:hypothetical protein [Scytolyngbya sp. HA4215-MV1]
MLKFEPDAGDLNPCPYLRSQKVVSMPEDYIVLITDDETTSTPIEGQRGWGAEVRQNIDRLREVRLPVAELERKMNGFLQLVGRLFKQVDQQIGPESGMQLNEVELLVEISAEGEIKLVAGGKAAGKGAITLKFGRIPAK